MGQASTARKTVHCRFHTPQRRTLRCDRRPVCGPAATLVDLHWGVDRRATSNRDHGQITIPDLVVRDYPAVIAL